MKLFPVIQKEAPVLLFVPMASDPGAALLKRACFQFFFAWFFPMFIYVNKIPSDPPLLKDEQSHFSQPFLRKDVLLSLVHLYGLSLEFPQYVYVSLVLGCPERSNGKMSFDIFNMNIKSCHGMKFLILKNKSK